MSSRSDLEAELLRDPFNGALRRRYAEALQEDKEFAEALRQFELVLERSPDECAVHQGIARCLLTMGKRHEAIEAYQRSRGCDDFEAAPELEELLGTARGARGSIRLVADNVTEIADFRREREEGIGFDDIAGMAELKKTLRLQIIEPFLHPELFNKFGKRAGGGVLLYGPPGCGKTMTARAIATECNTAFVSVGISDVLNMWIGESERNLATLFEKARAETGCVLFFDELDALAYSRSKAHSEHTRTVVNEFLAQLDGMHDENEGVLVLAATNMPWDVDSAMKRPGRFSRQVFVPPPDDEARAEMFDRKLADVPTEGIDNRVLAKKTPQFSGADIDGVIDRAKEQVLEDILSSGNERPIGQQDLLRACEQTTSTTADWLRTARNLVKYAGADTSYRDVEAYLKTNKLL